MKQTRWELLKQWWCDHFGHRVERDEWGIEACKRCLVLLRGPATKADYE